MGYDFGGVLIDIYCNNKDRNDVCAEIRYYSGLGYRTIYTDKDHLGFCFGVYWDTLEEARENVQKLRSSSTRVNPICNNCKNTECVGEFNQVYTGCIYKEF